MFTYKVTIKAKVMGLLWWNNKEYMNILQSEKSKDELYVSLYKELKDKYMFDNEVKIVDIHIEQL